MLKLELLMVHTDSYHVNIPTRALHRPEIAGHGQALSGHPLSGMGRTASNEQQLSLQLCLLEGPHLNGEQSMGHCSGGSCCLEATKSWFGLAYTAGRIRQAAPRFACHW